MQSDVQLLGHLKWTATTYLKEAFINIYVINKSTVVSDVEVQSWIPAFNVFLGHVRTWWPRPANLVWIDKAHEPKLAWKVIIADTSDEAGALGYHDFTPDGRPISYVFVKDDIKYGYSPTVTATHEIAEMIADPWISQLFQISDTQFFAQEIGDPVEADELGYYIKVDPYAEVLVSDFVTPRWFVPGSEGYVLDHNHKVTKPLELLPGGYMSVFTSGHGWNQIYAEKKTGNVIWGSREGKTTGKYSRLNKYGRKRQSLREHGIDWIPQDKAADYSTQ